MIIKVKGLEIIANWNGNSRSAGFGPEDRSFSNGYRNHKIDYDIHADRARQSKNYIRRDMR